VIYKEVMQLMEDYPDINLKVVGFMEFPADMQEYIKKGRITFSKLVDFIRLQELVASVDVNIVPLIVNDFTNCKSELKYFEASIVNTITCASPTYTYKNSIIDGTNGFLCEQSQWYDKILSIYHGKINDNQIRSNAYTHSINNYYGDKILNHIENTYNQIVDRKRS
jgi:glycosyltransferase involved in cell wall biosynthesis